MRKFTFTALIWLEDDVYVSKCPEIEVSSVGDTPDESLINLREAIDLWLVNAEELGILEDYLPTITSSTKFTSSIEVEI